MSVGGVAPVDAEVLLSEKQGIVTVKMDPQKIGSPELLFENFLELVLLQNTPSEHLDHLPEMK